MTKLFCFLRDPPQDEEGRWQAVVITEKGREVKRIQSSSPGPLAEFKQLILEPDAHAKFHLDEACPEGWTIEWVERNDPRPDVLLALRLLSARMKNYRIQHRAVQSRGRDPPREQRFVTVKRDAPGWTARDNDRGPWAVGLDLDQKESLTVGSTDRWENLLHTTCLHFEDDPVNLRTGGSALKKPDKYHVCVECGTFTYTNTQLATRRAGSVDLDLPPINEHLVLQEVARRNRLRNAEVEFARSAPPKEVKHE